MSLTSVGIIKKNIKKIIKNKNISCDYLVPATILIVPYVFHTLNGTILGDKVVIHLPIKVRTNLLIGCSVNGMYTMKPLHISRTEWYFC